MGWTQTLDRVDNIKQFITREYRNASGIRVADCAIVRFNTAYVALESNDPATNEREVWCDVWLLKRGSTFSYKTMSEDSGPFEFDCPERILRLLTPTQSESANGWRTTCWRNLQNRNNRPRLVPGDVFEVRQVMRFVDGFECQRFCMVNPRRLLCQAWQADDALEVHRLYRLPRQALTQQPIRILEHGLPIPVDKRGLPGVQEGPLLSVQVREGQYVVVAPNTTDGAQACHYFAALLSPYVQGSCHLTLGPTDLATAHRLSRRVGNYVHASLKLMHTSVVVRLSDSVAAAEGSLNALLPGWRNLGAAEDGPDNLAPAQGVLQVAEIACDAGGQHG